MSDHHPKPPDDDEVAFLRAMNAMGAKAAPTGKRAKAPDDAPDPDQLAEVAAAEDELFAEYMQAVEEGRQPSLPDRKPGDCDQEADAIVGAPPDPDCGKDEQDDDKALHGAARTLRRRLKKGEIAPTAEVDLHGQHKDQALNTLGAFLQRSQKNGHEIVLVITGRGLHSESLGVLREMVPLLLQRRWPEQVRQCLPAPRHLGGEGAFVVLLRRRS